MRTALLAALLVASPAVAAAPDRALMELQARDQQLFAARSGEEPGSDGDDHGPALSVTSTIARPSGD